MLACYLIKNPQSWDNILYLYGVDLVHLSGLLFLFLFSPSLGYRAGTYLAKYDAA